MSEENKQENSKENNELDSSASTDATPSVPLSPEETIAALEAQIQEHQDQFLRAKAEVENARRRSMEEVAKAHKFAIEGFAENLLPVMDSLNAALLDSGEDSAKKVDAEGNIESGSKGKTTAVRSGGGAAAGAVIGAIAGGGKGAGVYDRQSLRT